MVVREVVITAVLVVEMDGQDRFGEYVRLDFS